ncbi:Na/Pi cotransporter family protein [Chitinispirillales bacterium ANBcel5]|uniref:Na/Pi cotransporter family protein n=1 Tax=Cellulosispirillum alkaliphilum TaxID=3039283 RepID=UPI002A57355C|nr:Na/Pi cotransporter family protein [Chitinispirillales bacterium ANBcel5]
MDTALLLSMAFGVIGGLGIFLLGMKYMSDGLQTIAGDRLRSLIGMVTNNRLMATGVGALVTCIVQSSSITTVMVVGFVNSGLMTLRQSIGVIMGANIGTTITGWIVVLAIGKYGLPILGISALVFLFSKNEKIRYLGMTMMGIGMIFFGLQLMNDGLSPLRTVPEFIEWFQMFSADTYFGLLKCVLLGCLLTVAVQSSSATLAITITLASTGVISFQTAAALVLGENVGTTITAFFASLGTNTSNARRAAYAHIMFNIGGILWITTIFPLYINVLRMIITVDPDATVIRDGVEYYPYIAASIAAVHTGFNLINTLVFLPLVPFMASLLMKIVPENKQTAKPKLTHLDFFLLETPLMGIEQSKKEIGVMGEINRKMIDDLREVISTPEPDQKVVKKIFKREDILDNIQREITVFLTDLLSGGTVPHSISEEAGMQLRLADEYETISDYLTSILKLNLRLKEAGVELPQVMRDEMLQLHDMVAVFYEQIDDQNLKRHTSFLPVAVVPSGDQITEKFRDLRTAHLNRLMERKVDPMLSTVFPDILTSYRRVKEHVVNISEVITGVK